MSKLTQSLREELQVWYAYTFSLYHNPKVQYTHKPERIVQVSIMMLLYSTPSSLAYSAYEIIEKSKSKTTSQKIAEVGDWQGKERESIWVKDLTWASCLQDPIA